MPQLGFLFALLFAGGVVAIVVNWLWPNQVRAVALVVLTIFSLVWLAAGFNLPLTLTLGPASAGGVPAWSWEVDSGAWMLSLALLLLSLAALGLSRPGVRPGRGPLEPSTLTYLLAASALPAFWSDNLIAHVAGWALLSLVWALILSSGLKLRLEPRSLLRRLGTVWAAILLLWLAALAAAGSDPETNITAWPTLGRSLVLLATVWQLLAFSTFARHVKEPQEEAPVVALLHVVPAAAGALLLARLDAAGAIGPAFSLPLTLSGLLGFLLAMQQAWSYQRREGRVAAALIVGQANLTLLAGVWAGPEAVLAETRVLLVSGAVLLLTAIRTGDGPTTLLPKAGSILAAAALSAVPLTAGFTGRSAVYASWLAQGRWVLLLVTAFLHLPLASAALAFLWPRDASFLAPERKALRREVGEATMLALPALLLFSATGVAQATPAAWIVTLAPLALALFFRLAISGDREVQPALRDALAVHLPLETPSLALRRLASGCNLALRQALAILEGEGGMLWLLVLLVIFWLAR